MSLFIGKDSNGKDIIHITDGTYSAIDMKNGIKPDTTFHNDLEFSTYDMYPVAAVMSDSRGYYCVGDQTYPGDPYGDKYQMGGGDGVIASRGASEVYWLDANKNIIQPDLIVWGDRYQAAKYALNWSYLRTTRSYTYYIPYMVVPDGSCDRYEIALPIKYAVVLTKTKIITAPGVQINATTSTARAKFLVGGFDLANIKYVSHKILNSHPECLTINGIKQLIDASKISGSIEIISNPLEGTQIKKGGHVIIKGSSHGQLFLVNTYTRVCTIPSGITYFPYTIKFGEVHKITVSIGSVQTGSIQTFLVIEGSEICISSFKYRVNDSQGFFSYYAEGALYYGISGGRAYSRGTVNDGKLHSYTVKIDIYSY